jgi:hypothetical protein
MNMPLYKGLVGVVVGLLDPDRIRIIDSMNVAANCFNGEEFDRFLIANNDDDEPFPRLEFWKTESRIGVIESELWVRVGGPHPYHDSFTLALYTFTDLGEKLVKLSQTYANGTGVNITEVIWGNSVGKPDGPINKILGFMGLR